MKSAEKNFYRAKLGEHQRPDEGDMPPLDFCSNFVIVKFQLSLLSSYATKNGSTDLNSTQENYPRGESWCVRQECQRDSHSRDAVSEVSGLRICCRNTFSVTISLQQRSVDIPQSLQKKGFSRIFMEGQNRQGQLKECLCPPRPHLPSASCCRLNWREKRGKEKFI